MELLVLQLLREKKTTDLINLLSQNPSLIKFEDSNGISLFLLSIYYGNGELTEYLSSKRNDLNFFEACGIGNVPRVEALSALGQVNINSHSRDGFTGLGLASYFGHEQMVKYLLQEGADPNLASSNSFRVAPIHSATSSGYFGIAQMLLEHGADVNLKQQKNITPIHVAAHRGDLLMVKLFIKYKADLAARSDDAKSVYDYAIESGNDDVISFLRTI